MCLIFPFLTVLLRFISSSWFFSLMFCVLVYWYSGGVVFSFTQIYYRWCASGVSYHHSRLSISGYNCSARSIHSCVDDSISHFNTSFDTSHYYKDFFKGYCTVEAVYSRYDFSGVNVRYYKLNYGPQKLEFLLPYQMEETGPWR